MTPAETAWTRDAVALLRKLSSSMLTFDHAGPICPICRCAASTTPHSTGWFLSPNHTSNCDLDRLAAEGEALLEEKP